MNGEKILETIIQAIFSWPGIVLLIAIFFILVFREEISGFLKGVRQIKAKGLELNTEHWKKEELSQKEELNKEEKQVKEKIREVQEEEEPKNLDEWRTKMILEIFDKNQESADRAFQKMQELNFDPLSRKKDEILYLQYSYTIGKADAISRIRTFLAVIDKDVVYDANMALGFCYSNSDDFENSNLFYSQAFEKAQNNDQKSQAASEYSSLLYRDNKKTRAIEILIETLSVVKEDVYRIRLYESLAEIYEKENDHENRAFVLDKAIELKPNDPKLIFKAGYSYAESNYDELSLLHYKNAKAINPRDEAIQNNLGVQYDNLKMPIKSILSYKEAERLGNTLASANLAYRLIGAGFAEEASKILNIAKDKEDPHPNVNLALAEIPNKVEQEEKIEENENKSALNLRKFFLGFADAKFINGESLKSISGNWKSGDEIVFWFEITGNKISATWKRKLINHEYDWKLEGDVFNNSSVITIYEKEYSFSKNKYEYQKKGRGFLFCSRDGAIIRFIEIDDFYHTKKIFILKKIQ